MSRRSRKSGVSLPEVALLWVSQLVLWLIFADNSGFREIIVGAIAAAIGTYFVPSFIARTRASFEFRARWVLQVMHVPKLLFVDTGILLRVVTLRVLGKDVPAAIIAVKFDAGGDDAPSRAQRALATTYLTFAPNTLVMGIPRDQQLLFFHTVIPQPLPRFMLNLGARIVSEKP
jgi:multisubunit Na+/H+ antiporter MnhE subunit